MAGYVIYNRVYTGKKLMGIIELQLQYSGTVGDKLIDEFIESLEKETFYIDSKKNKQTVVNAAAWELTPHLIELYVADKFFEGFISEAGKDVYQNFKNSVYALFKGIKDKHVAYRMTGKEVHILSIPKTKKLKHKIDNLKRNLLNNGFTITESDKAVFKPIKIVLMSPMGRLAFPFYEVENLKQYKKMLNQIPEFLESKNFKNFKNLMTKIADDNHANFIIKGLKSDITPDNLRSSLKNSFYIQFDDKAGKWYLMDLESNEKLIFR